MIRTHDLPPGIGPTDTLEEFVDHDEGGAPLRVVQYAFFGPIRTDSSFWSKPGYVTVRMVRLDGLARTCSVYSLELPGGSPCPDQLAAALARAAVFVRGARRVSFAALDMGPDGWKRLQAVADGEHVVLATDPMLYYGAWPGHEVAWLRDRVGAPSSPAEVLPEPAKLPREHRDLLGPDGQPGRLPWTKLELEVLAPAELAVAGVAFAGGWTAVVIRDQSVAGSNVSAWMLPGAWSLDDAVEQIKATMPQRWALVVAQPGWPDNEGTVRRSA